MMWNSEQSILLILGVWATVQMGLMFRANPKRDMARRR